MRWHYSLSDFYVLLKLGIFRGGNIKNLGRVRICNESFCFRKELTNYEQKQLCYRQISLGIYLLDLFQISKEKNAEKVFIMRLFVFSGGMNNDSKEVLLKITTQASGSKIKRISM